MRPCAVHVHATHRPQTRLSETNTPAVLHVSNDPSPSVPYLFPYFALLDIACALFQVLNHQQLSLCNHPHITKFHEVFLTPRYLGKQVYARMGTQSY